MSVQELDVEVAAGGLLWRDARAREKLAVVHRERHEDWSLPKGKFDPDKDEKWVETAIREVREETECKFHVDEFADCISYLVDDTPKVVLFWNMDLDEEPEDFEEPSEADPKDEVDKRRWMSVPEAMEYLDYPDQRTLVARAASRPLLVKCRGDPVRTHGWRRLFSWSLWPRSASHGRLVSVLKPYRAELSHLTAKVERTRGYKDSEELPWAEAACSLLEEARVALDENDTDRAWRCFLGANRLELFGLDELGQEDGRDQGDEWEGDHPF